MNPTFWHRLPRPFCVLAPMAHVTDVVFRTLIARYGKPDVMWTEFVSADGLVSEGRERLLIDLAYSEAERPIVAQLFTGHPEAMLGAAQLVKKLGFDGLDINMGCPDRAVERQGGGAALIKDPAHAAQIIQAAREGAPSLPVSVKTRLGYNSLDRGWISFLLHQQLPALTIHLRTRKEMSQVPAHWELMPEIVALRDEISPTTLIIGNGDIGSLSEARDRSTQYGCDGVMIGRGIFGTPWLFAPHTVPKTPRERLQILVEHTQLFWDTFNGIKSFDVMKKHFKAYVAGWDGAKDLRAHLMEARDAEDVKRIIDNYIRVF